MVFKTVLADVVKQVLQVGNLNDAGAPKRLQGIVGEGPLSDIG